MVSYAPSRELRVGFSLATLVPRYVGGAESYARGVLEALVRSESKTIGLRILANRDAAEAYRPIYEGEPSTVRITPGRFGEGELVRALSMARMRIRAGAVAARVGGDVDLIHYPLTVPLPHVDLPRVVTLFDMQHHEHPEFFSRAELLYRRWAYDGAARAATRVITLSNHARGEIIRRLGIEPHRVHTVAPGIDHKRFVPTPVANEQQLLEGLSLPPRFVLYPANLWPHKNHEALIKALAGAGDPDLFLVLTGQTYGRLGRLLELASERGVGGRVRHLGHVPAAAVPVLYRAALALVHPSRFEGFGFPALEAMACGCPVAASRRASLPELVEGSGLLFEADDPTSIADALRRLTTDEAAREQLIIAGLERAAGFSWPRAAADHVDVYRLATGG